MDISMQPSEFLYWLREAMENTNEFLKTQNGIRKDKWTESLLSSPNGDAALSFIKFALKFSLLTNYKTAVKNNSSILTLK